MVKCSIYVSSTLEWLEEVLVVIPIALPATFFVLCLTVTATPFVPCLILGKEQVCRDAGVCVRTCVRPRACVLAEQQWRGAVEQSVV